MNTPEILGEIIQGYSELKSGSSTYFFKHPSIADRLSVGREESRLYAHGKELGFLTKDELLERAIGVGAWSKDLEEDIRMLKWVAERREAQLKKLSDPSMKAELEKSIEKDKEELLELSKRRAKLSIGSLEDYVFSKLPTDLCCNEVFYGKDFATKIEDSLKKSLITPYLEKNSELTERNNMLKAVYSTSFFDLFFIYSSFDEIFKKDIYGLTIFQKELIGYGRVLYSKLTKIANIPESVKNDPLKLYFYEEKMTDKENETNLRKYVEDRGGLENMTVADKAT